LETVQDVLILSDIYVSDHLNPAITMSIRPEKEFIKISVLESAIEAQVMEAILKEENIAYRIRSFHDTAYNGLFQFQKGWGELFALSAYKNKINEILENIRNQDI